MQRAYEEIQVDEFKKQIRAELKQERLKAKREKNNG